MKKLHKIPLPKVRAQMIVQCPKHHPAYINGEHIKCYNEWVKELEKTNKNSLAYKQIEVLNELIDRMNEDYEERLGTKGKK